MNKILSLYELTSLIQSEISNSFNAPLWVKAELVKLNYYPQSGHCYPDLVEKENNKIKAQIRAIIWKDNFTYISEKFRLATNSNISAGMQLLFRIQVNYSQLYGLSLIIQDIDPTYTMGAMAFEKQQALKKLQDADVLRLNKSITPPALIQRLAIISVESSKGYNDFINTINEYKDRYTVVTKIFPAILQGDTAIPSLRKALSNIKAVAENFDAVVVIRGGGGEIGLSCYNNYELAYDIATFPIPVITGIGHSTDSSLCDIVAAVSLKTPTEAANFILSRFAAFEKVINDISKSLSDNASEILEYEQRTLTKLSTDVSRQFLSYSGQQRQHLDGMLKNIESGVKNAVVKNNFLLNNQVYNIVNHTKSMIAGNKNSLRMFDVKCYLLNPKNILKRGYSITTINGKAIKNAKAIDQDAIIETQLFEGKLTSRVVDVTASKTNK
ncbi:MAG: exodeoxyribonuclease VII large subunit [Bacteroidales bacterium]|nr:exodeoxyribonuclease VII large subunit [Bacteroidales bacterium]MDD3152472.1 exodeoxyribonuclease VII large subunit [Bacteroidales bacterium]MDD3914772.1 exodeoxyribonuclease VII large subunit [Bacteroidales bacterium]MDD4634199.1 exodeoxyribonuclease VII large subunit [Bacteroidales bacterium]